jgi:hypothetical protein
MAVQPDRADPSAPALNSVKLAAVHVLGALCDAYADLLPIFGLDSVNILTLARGQIIRRGAGRVSHLQLACPIPLATALAR